MAQFKNSSVNDNLVAATVSCLARVRERQPRIHSITNEVAANYTANSLLAIGAIPSMTTNPVEMPEFVGGADALLVNLGTLGATRIEAINIAVDVARGNAIRWCLDPVFVERSSSRLSFANALIARQPDVVRANVHELNSLGLGDNEAVANASCIARTGVLDKVRCQSRSAVISNGHPMMATVTATGCALSALITAFLAVGDDAFEATVAAICVLGVSGELAASNCNGPGSFQNALLDQLYHLDQTTIDSRAKIN